MNGFRPVGNIEQIPGAAEGFLGREVVQTGRMSKQEQYGTIPQPKFHAEGNLVVERELEQAEAIKSALDASVTTHVEETGMVGPDLPALVDATKKVAELKDSETPEIRLQVAETNLKLADDNVTRHKREHGGQNGDLSALLDATVKARQAREANSK